MLLDSDIVWMKDVNFKVPNSTTQQHNYAYSSQWHASYRSTMKMILDIEHASGTYMSGICHHMVILKHVIEDMKRDVLARYSLPLWQMMLNASARELTCRAPRGILTHIFN